MEGFHLPRDIIFKCICPHLSLDDLRVGMLVCVSWFKTLIADGAFDHFRAKVLREAPELIVLFTEHPWEFGDERTAESIRPSRATKRIKAWIMPRGGTWYVLKHYIDRARRFSGMKLLYAMKDPLSKIAIVASAKRMISPPEEEERWYESHRFEADGFRSSWFTLVFQIKGTRNTIRVQFARHIRIYYSYTQIEMDGFHRRQSLGWKIPYSSNNAIFPLGAGLSLLRGFRDIGHQRRIIGWHYYYGTRPASLLRTLNLEEPIVEEG